MDVGRRRNQLEPATRRTFLIVPAFGRVQEPTKALDGAIAFVREHLLPQDAVAVIAFHRVTTFTTDHEAIAQVLTRYKKEHERIWWDAVRYFMPNAHALLGAPGPVAHRKGSGPARAWRPAACLTDGLHTGQLEVTVYCGDDKQKVIGETKVGWNLRANDETFAAWLKNGLQRTLRVPVTAKPKFVKVIVYDPISDRTGSMTATINEPSNFRTSNLPLTFDL